MIHSINGVLLVVITGISGHNCKPSFRLAIFPHPDDRIQSYETIPSISYVYNIYIPYNNWLVVSTDPPE